MTNEKTNEQFKHDMATARGYVSAERIVTGKQIGRAHV